MLVHPQHKNEGPRKFSLKRAPTLRHVVSRQSAMEELQEENAYYGLTIDQYCVDENFVVELTVAGVTEHSEYDFWEFPQESAIELKLHMPERRDRDGRVYVLRQSVSASQIVRIHIPRQIQLQWNTYSVKLSLNRMIITYKRFQYANTARTTRGRSLVASGDTNDPSPPMLTHVLATTTTTITTVSASSSPHASQSSLAQPVSSTNFSSGSPMKSAGSKMGQNTTSSSSSSSSSSSNPSQQRSPDNPVALTITTADEGGNTTHETVLSDGESQDPEELIKQEFEEEQDNVLWNSD